jgi:hypothetical protein
VTGSEALTPEIIGGFFEADNELGYGVLDPLGGLEPYGCAVNKALLAGCP